MRAFFLATLLAAAIAVAPQAGFAQQVPTGAQEFAMSCTPCHGADARGDGPVARALTVKPANLTTLAKRNNGVFPLDKVVDTIDGRAQVAAHGTRAMPVWGARYEEEVAKQYGPYGSESVIKTRIQALANYLKSIQEK